MLKYLVFYLTLNNEWINFFLQNLCMKNQVIAEASFSIEFNDCEYPGVLIKVNGRKVYQLRFPGSFIYLTQAVDREGETFWTSVPQDLKLNHIIPYLGKQIEDKNL